MHDQQHRPPVHPPATSGPGTGPRLPVRRPTAPEAEPSVDAVQRKEDGGHARCDAPPPAAPPPGVPILRKCDACEEEEAQKKHPGAPLAVSHPSDPLEQEADKVAERVMRAADPAIEGRAPALVLSRAQDHERAPTEAGAGAIVGDVLRSGGQPLPEATRSFMEPRFGRDFGDVRVHTGAEASRSAEAVAARAYTVGSHVVFRAGEYAPHAPEGARLLAHELTHVAQQAPGGGPVQAAPAPGEGIKLHRDTGTPAGGGAAPAAPAGGTPDAGSSTAATVGGSTGAGATGATGATPPGGLIVDDGEAKLDPKQMRKGAFLAAARSAVDAAVNEGYDSLVDRIAARAVVAARFLLYGAQDAKSLEQTIHGQVGASAATAAGYIPAIVGRVKAEIAADVADKKKNEKKGGGLFFKGREGGPREGGDPEAVKAALEGGGEPLPGGLRSGVESAMGHDFSGVRVHTGATAQKLSGDLDARAFTVGRDVAFAAGEYQPGTPTGDALIAHELAHVAQQGGSSAAVAPKSETGNDGPLEADADAAATGAVLSIWGGVKAGALGLARKAAGTLKSGLRLQRCKSEPPAFGSTKAIMDKVKGCDGGTGLADAASKAVGGKDPEIVPGKPRSGFRGETNARSGEITIASNLDACTATQTLVQELSNVSKKAEFNKLDDDAAKGDVSRADYIRRNEEIEYFGVKNSLKAWDACKDAWGCPKDAVSTKEGFRKAKDFNDYFDNLLAKEHKDFYGKYWDDHYKSAWEKKHP